MAEIIRALEESEARKFLPVRGMYEPQRREVYEAAGKHIMMLHELNGGFTETGGDLLLQLDDGYYVSFSYSTHEGVVQN